MNMQAPEKGFFGALFDVSFKHFITLKFIKVIYIIVMVLIGLFALLAFLAVASNGGGGAAILVLLLLAPLALLYLVLARISLEVIAVLFRIGENTAVLAAAQGGGQPGQYGYGVGPAWPGQSPDGGYGQPPQPQQPQYPQQSQYAQPGQYPDQGQYPPAAPGQYPNYPQS
jgi:hypothetical protein